MTDIEYTFTGEDCSHDMELVSIEFELDEETNDISEFDLNVYKDYIIESLYNTVAEWDE